jgi:hypothetical protein
MDDPYASRHFPRIFSLIGRAVAFAGQLVSCTAAPMNQAFYYAGVGLVGLVLVCMMMQVLINIAASCLPP